MDHTQNDLSYNHTKLDYQAMVKTAQIAFASSRDGIARLIHQTYDINPHVNYKLIGQRIKEEADRLVIAAETMYTLDGGLEREELEIVNKPEVKHEDDTRRP